MLDLVFFDMPKGSRWGPAPRLSISPKGQVQLSPSATAHVQAEPGASANLCYDQAGRRWLLAYWPEGQKGQPALRQGRGHNDRSVSFGSLGATKNLFAQHKADPAVTRKTLNCALLPEALTDPAHPTARFYLLGPTT